MDFTIGFIIGTIVGAFLILVLLGEKGNGGSNNK